MKPLFGHFWDILASKSRPKFDHNFGMLFCRIPGLQREREGTARGLRRQYGGGPGATDAPRRRPFRARNDPITPHRRTPRRAAERRKHRKRDLTRRGPEAWPLCVGAMRASLRLCLDLPVPSRRSVSLGGGYMPFSSRNTSGRFGLLRILGLVVHPIHGGCILYTPPRLGSSMQFVSTALRLKHTDA